MYDLLRKVKLIRAVSVVERYHDKWLNVDFPLNVLWYTISTVFKSFPRIYIC